MERNVTLYKHLRNDNSSDLNSPEFFELILFLRKKEWNA